MNWQAIAFDWNQIRAFLATAEEGSLGAAARALNSTQPTVGRQVAALEADLGVTLFERSGRTLAITGAGKDLLERCIILEGVMGILEGMHPKLLKELLLSFLGESGHSMYKEGFETREKEKLESYLEKIEEKPAASDSSAKLGKVIARLNGKAIKQFLQIINIEDLAKAIKDMDGKVQIKLFNLLPERGASLLLESVQQMESIGPDQVLEAQNKVVAIITELKEQGRIGS